MHKILRKSEVSVEFGSKTLKPLEEYFKGSAVRTVEAYGKQFRIHFEDNRIILIHLLMWGSWRIYRKGQEWDKSIN